MMKRFAAALLLGAVVALGALSLRDPSPAGVATSVSPNSFSAAPVFQAHIDSTTGDFIDGAEFEAPDLPEGLLDSLRSDDADLVEEAAPGGGLMVRTAGRYHNIYWGTRTESGEAKAVCLSPEELKQEMQKP